MLQGTIGFIRVLGKYYGVSAAPLKGEQVGATGVQLHPQSTKGTWGTPPPPRTASGLFIPTVSLSPPARGRSWGGGHGNGVALGPPIRAAPPPATSCPHPPTAATQHRVMLGVWGGK